MNISTANHTENNVQRSTAPGEKALSEIGLRVWRGANAEQLLGDGLFCERWNLLYHACEWATVLQNTGFACAWYEIYREQYEPLLILETNNQKQLVGLFTLAVERATGGLVYAGVEQAEYQTWLATNENRDSFIEQALDALQKMFPNVVLRLSFVPPKTPLEWIRTGKWSGQSELREIERPLIDVGDGSEMRKSLKKSGNRSRIKALERLGKLELARLTTKEELAAVYDTVDAYARLRLSGAYNTFFPFNPNKKQLHLELMNVPGLVHATVLKVGDQIGSAHFNTHNRDELLLGMVAYSPFLASLSPGSFHIRLLGVEAARENIATFDLTPGGDYKNRSANRFDTAFILQVFFNRKDYLHYQTKRKFINGGKEVMRRFGIERERATTVQNKIRHKLRFFKPAAAPKKLLLLARRKTFDTREMRVYALSVSEIAKLPKPETMRRNRVKDLLAYQPAEGWQMTVHEFHREALRRLENGESVYTHQENDLLLHYGWLIPRQERSHLSEVGTDFYPPPNSALLYDYYTHPTARGRGLYRNSLCQMLSDAAAIPDTERVFIAVLADNSASRHVIEKVNFQYQYSFFQQTRFGKIRRWTNAPEVVSGVSL